MSAKRLTDRGRIDRTTPVRFTWDGRALQGFAGDTLASALMANGETLLGRSFKYHRPRGIMSAGVEESGAIVSLGAGARHEPNVRATTQELFEGLVAKGQNAWPDVRRDWGAVSGLFSRFFSAGFYYKTFMGIPPFEWGQGTGIWMQYEKLIRRAAGMGEASRAPDPDSYDHAHGFCDVLVVGAGPAGLNAAAALAESGLDVVLVEQDFELGGDFLSRARTPMRRRGGRAWSRTLEQAGVRIMTRTTAFGLYDCGTAGLLERVTDHLADADPDYLPRQRFWTLRAKQTILATGALERTIAFGNNDRPGVMTAAAAQTYLNRFGVLAGGRILVATNNDSAYGVATELAGAGADVKVLDARSSVAKAKSDALLASGVRLQLGAAPLEAYGRGELWGVQTARADGDGWAADNIENCDLLLVSGGWSPVVNLLSHRGCKPVWNAENACFLPGETNEADSYGRFRSRCLGRRRLCERSGHAAAAAAVLVGTGQVRDPLRAAPDAGRMGNADPATVRSAGPGQEGQELVPICKTM